MTPRPNTRRKSPIREAIDAIEAMLNISHRIEGCADINCRVCPDTKETLEGLRIAKARLEKEERK